MSSLTLFARYRMEREGGHTLEKEHGFATYLMGPEECYIQDIYVLPEHRKGGLAAEMADEIAEIGRDQGCTVLTGSVDVRTKRSTDSLKVLLAYGMFLSEVRGNMIIMSKDLQGGNASGHS